MSRDPETLVRAAVAGTSQASLDGGWTGTLVDELAAGVEGPPEHRLLLAAGAWAVVRQAGTKLDGPVVLPAAAPPETRPECPSAVADLLRPLCRGGTEAKPRLVLAAGRLERAGLRLPPDLLPLVLDETDAEVREALRPVLGERGRWLAGFREPWRWATAGAGEALSADAEEIWEEGALAERRDVLQEIRRLDPARARGWLQEVWKAEKAKPRAELLDTFSEGLSEDDEEFLETALDDRSAKVREIAARLLVRLPGSALCERMTERALRFLSWEPPPEKKGFFKRLVQGEPTGVLTVELPAEVPDDWRRDGIQPDTRPLYQVLEKVPPERFAERFAAEPAALVAAAAANDGTQMILEAWTVAAARFRSRDWIAPLWDALLTPRKTCYVADPLEYLTSVMDKDELAERLLRLFPQEPHNLDSLLGRLPGPWPPELARAYLARALRVAGTNRLLGHVVRVAFRLPEEVLAEARAVDWPKLDRTKYWQHEWDKQVRSFQETIEFRQTLIREVPL